MSKEVSSESLLAMRSVALRAPAAPGVNVTVNVVLAPGVSVVGAGETTTKSPELGPSGAMLVSVRLSLPTLRTV